MIGPKVSRSRKRTARTDAGTSAAFSAAVHRRKAFSLFMAVVLAVSLVPSPVWAQGSAGGQDVQGAQEAQEAQEAQDASCPIDAGSIAEFSADGESTAGSAFASAAAGDITGAGAAAGETVVAGDAAASAASATSEGEAASASTSASASASSKASSAAVASISPASSGRAAAVNLYKVEVSGSARVGQTLTAQAYERYSSTPISDDADVEYQWQYATTKSTSNSAFKDIPGATGKTYQVGDAIDGASSLGKYVRVKATAGSKSVVSTEKPSYYGTTYVDPLGPIMVAGAYELSSVKLSSSGQGMQVGNTITPKAQVKSGYYENDVPSDAKVTYTWWMREGDEGEFTALSEADGVHKDGSLVLSESLLGKQVKVSANALVEGNNPASAAYTVLAAGEYDLLRATLSPSSGDLFTGDALSVAVQAKSIAGTSYGDYVTSDVAISWSASDSADGDFEPLADVSGAEIALPAAAAGKFVKATATSGSSRVEVVTARAVVDADTLEGAAKKLDAAGFRPTPVYGTDTNINDVVEAELAELGYEGISVTTLSATPSMTNDLVSVGVSAAEGEGNGAISYCTVDLDNMPSYASYSSLRQFRFKFQLQRDGQTYDYEPSLASTIPWDDGSMADQLEEAAEGEGLSLGFADGDSAQSVTGSLSMPTKLSDKTDAGKTKSWSAVSWSSDNETAISVTGYSWSSSYTGKVTRTARDQEVALKATIGFSTSGMPDITVEKTFDVVVKSDAAKVEQAKIDLEQKVEAGFTADGVVYGETGGKVDCSCVTGDMRLPNPSSYGLDGKYYSVTYAPSNDAASINGYAANVYRPLPGADSRSVDITVTVTDKSNPEITASKTLSFSLIPLDGEDIESEVALMNAAKAGYFDAIAEGQAPVAVTKNLHAFQRAYRDAEGNLAWAYNLSDADAAGSGIVPVDLAGYDPMGTFGWRVFKSSNPGIVSHENLLVNRPKQDTQVTVSSCLSSQKYARYASIAAYAEDPTYGPLFAQLANQDVSCTFTVQGTLPPGQELGKVTATCTVVGVDESGQSQTWAALHSFTLDEGSTAADLSEALFAATGLEAECGWGSYGWYLNTITSPFDDGRVLGWDESTWKYWQLFVKGAGDEGYALSDQYASSIELQDGDSVMWCYAAWGEEAADPGKVTVVPDASRPSFDAAWSGFANGMTGSSVSNRQTPVESVEEASWVYDYLAKGSFMTAASEPVIANGHVFLVVENELRMIDARTGSLVASAPLGSTISYQCRPVYSDGLVIVPADDGTLTAFTADALICAWRTEPLSTEGYGKSYQSLSSLTVNAGNVYAGFTMVGAGGKGKVGTLVCVSLDDGSLVWSRTDQAEEGAAFGYYWAGAAASGDDVVVGDDSGMVSLLDGATGEVRSSVSVGAPVRSSVVADASYEGSGAAYLVVSNDGTLHRIVREGDTLSVDASVSFASKSTSTPAVAGGKAFVCAINDAREGTLCVIDLKTMSLEKTVAGGKGYAQCSPLVSVRQDGSTYVYFTCNGLPGGVYVYRVGDDAAQALYTPDKDHQQYCMSSVAVDAAGNLYYTNDSGALFAIAAAEGGSGGSQGGGEGSDDKPNGGGTGSGDSGSGGSQGGSESGSGNAGNGSTSSGSGNATSASGSTAGTVAPGRTPLDQRGDEAGEEAKKDAEEDAEEGSEEGAEAVALISDDFVAADGARGTYSGAESDVDSAMSVDSTNTMAIVGLCVGCAALVGAVLYLLLARRRKAARDDERTDA